MLLTKPNLRRAFAAAFIATALVSEIAYAADRTTQNEAVLRDRHGHPVLDGSGHPVNAGYGPHSRSNGQT